ncbi:MAG: metalloregulator ArsR/SmtB family transcription factor [Anaerolineae bacterium]
MTTKSKTTQHAAADVFTAIAHPARRGILDMLASGEMTVTTIAAQPFGMSRPAVSQHLAVLLESGLVSMETRGRENYYQLRPENLNEVYRWITHFERFWPEKLDALGAYLDTLEDNPHPLTPSPLHGEGE